MGVAGRGTENCGPGGHEHKYDDVRCAQFGRWRGARREHPPKWGCNRRATKPQAKFGATRRAAGLFRPDFVARSLQIHGGICSSLAPRLGEKSLAANVIGFMFMTTKLLLCPPDYYGIEYEINPWMSRGRGADREQAFAQWQQLRQTLETLGGEVELLAPQPQLPDLVFTANAGLLIGKRFIPSNFHHKERRGEQVHFEKWFAEHGYEIARLPEKLFFEGEGDALFHRDVFFCGSKFRPDIRSHQRLGDLLRCLVLSVELVDNRFHHLAPCSFPLPTSSPFALPPP